MGPILLMIRNLCFLSAGKQRCSNDFIDIKEEICCVTAIFFPRHFSKSETLNDVIKKITRDMDNSSLYALFLGRL